MPERPHRALAEHIVDHLSANGKDALFRNGDLPGLGIRVYSAGGGGTHGDCCARYGRASTR